MKEFETKGDMQASTQSLSGTRVVARDEGDVEYIVTDPGYAAAENDVVFNNGRVGARVTDMTTADIINSRRAYRAGAVIRTIGFYNAENGGSALWRATSTTGLTPMQTPADLGEAALADGLGRKWELVTDGVIDASAMGAINSTSSAQDSTDVFAATYNHCASTGDSWSAYGDYWVDKVDCETSFTGKATFYSSNDGQAYGVLNLKREVLTGDASLINSALPLSKGTTNIPSMGVYSGSVVRIASGSKYLVRNGSSSDYRYDIAFYVTNSAGDIYPALPHDVSGVTMDLLEYEQVGEKISIDGIGIKLTSGSSPRNSVVSCGRSNLDLSVNAKNETSTPVAQIFNIPLGVYAVNLLGCDAVGAKVDSTNYGYNVSGCGHNLIGCESTDCRRGFDATYANDVNIIGGHYENGIGAHLGFNIKVSDSYAGYSDGNVNPLHFTGGDITVTGTTAVTRDGAIFEARKDAPEIIGSVKLTGNRFIFDHSSKTGATSAFVFSLSMPNTPYSGARDLLVPAHVSVQSNSVECSGSSAEPSFAPVHLFVNGSSFGGLFTGGMQADFGANSYTSESDTQEIKITANKTSQVGDVDVKLNYMDAVECDFFIGNAGTSTTGGVIDLYAPNLTGSSVRGDYGWLDKSKVSRGRYSAATGTPSYLSSSRWESISNSGKSSIVYNIPDDGVMLIDKPSNYFNVHLSRANDATRSGYFAVDADGGGQVGLIYSNGSVANAGSTPLTGTTGTDGNITVSCDGNYLYVENRSGNGAVMFISLETMDV